MKHPATLLFFILMFNVTLAHADPYFCNAPWPPPAGSDRTMGKDSNGQVCIKISQPPTTTWWIFYAKGESIYYSEVKADTIELTATHLICKYAGKEVAKFDLKYVIGWRTNP